MSTWNTTLRSASRFIFAGLIAVLAACGGGGGGGGDSGGGSSSAPATTTISGKVTVPSDVGVRKPGYAAKLMANKPHGKPGSKVYMASRKPVLPSGVVLPGGSYEKAFDLGAVWLYNADHPEWLYPVATADVVAGAYTLSKTKFAALNGNAYSDDQPIPSGNYTLFAYDAADSGLIALKVVVNKYAGNVVGVDLVAEPSDVAPIVQTILGANKNTDGTMTWGSTTYTGNNSISTVKNGSIQVSFSSAMNRVSIKDNISIKTAGGSAVAGTWQVSPDWKTAIFAPTAGTMAAGNYVVTIQGKDTFPAAFVKNVYGNALAKTSTGYFTVADVTDTSAPNATVKLYLNGAYLTSADKNSVDVITAIRVKSDELLDVSSLVLTGSPSLGAKPTASYVGKDALDATYPYVYEFSLGVPLTLATSYSVTVSGGKDLAGNVMNSTTYSFTTAQSATGISSGADTATQTVQAEVKDVFGKWVRAMSDRNLSQVQGLMTGGFVYEYDASKTGINEADTNYDSRLSLNEFSSMLQKAFDGWAQCGTTLTGDVTADITVSGSTAGMQFTLSATSTSTSYQCSDMSPKQTMYAVLEKVNGAWYVSRAAEGIDIRNKDLVLRDAIAVISPKDGTTLTVNPAVFEWNAAQGVTSYILLVADDNGHGLGAIALPSTTTKVDPASITIGTNAVDVSSLFGGSNGPTGPNGLDLMRDGATFKWEVLGLGTNTFDNFKNGTYKDVLRDIKAISTLNTYKNAGTYLALTWQAQDLAGSAIPYNDWYWAYDAGNAGQIKVHVTAPLSGTLQVDVSGTGYASQSIAVTANVATDVTLNLYQGMNWVSMNFNDGGSHYLYDGFSVNTTGGIPPAVSITSVLDNTGATYSKCTANPTAPCIDQWGYLSGTSANTVTIYGKVDLTQVPGASTVGVSNSNSSGAYDYKEVAVDANGNFTAQMDVYNGDNWFNFNAHDSNWMYWGYAYMGINTSAGSTWTPPIAVSVPNGVTQMVDYGGSQDWDASAVTSNQISITGTLKAPNQSYSAQYYVSSNGGWNSGMLAVSGNTFTLPVTLYNGWNWVSIDDGSGHTYGLNIYTSGGAVPVRPVITSVAGQTFDINVTNSVTVNAAGVCSVTLTGTLGNTAGNMLSAYWYGYDGWTAYYENSTASSDATGKFTVTMPVVGNAAGYSGSYNYIDLYDSQSNWAGAVVYETSGCTYTPPVNTVTGVTVNNGDTATLTDYGSGSYGVALTTGQATGMTVTGNNSKVGKTITGYVYSCGTTQAVQATSDINGNWSLGQFNLYDGYNSVNISDGYSSSYLDVTTGNGIVVPPAITLTSSSPAVNSQTWTGCGSDGYSVDMGGAATITVNGVLNKTPGSSGYYSTSSGTSASFTTDANGNFSISVPVSNGYNYLYLYDANWNSYSVELYVTNGYVPPPALKIDSPAHNASMLTGNITVSGHADLSQWLAAPNYYYAYVYNSNTGSYVDYSSDPIEQASYGYTPITVDANGNFSFPAYIDSNWYTEIYVYAYDPSSGSSHGDDIYVNNVYGYSEYTWKPGTRPAASKLAKTVLSTERRVKHMAQIQAKSLDLKRRLHR